MAAPLPPVDATVAIPAAVQRASALADEAHKAAYLTDTPVVTAPVTQTPDPAVAQAPDPSATQEADAPVTQTPPVDPDANVTAEEWHNRYKAMKGRFDQSCQTIDGMQRQMGDLGDELLRTQRMVRPQNNTQTRTQPPKRLLTDEDVKTYGPELLDVVQRAAKEALASDLDAVSRQNQQLSQRVTQQVQQGVYGALNAEVPNWNEVNQSPRFKAWCGLRDIYSGQLRGTLLQNAFQAADAPRVVAFFKGFLSEEQATGHLPAPQPAPQTDAQRVPAVSLTALAAPGRAHPATGDNTAQAEKPVFTRAQISNFYTLVRKGAYEGRETDKARDEAAIFAAQREGRVRN